MRRRQFLQVGAAAGAAAVGATYTLPRLLGWRHDPDLSQRAPLGSHSRVLVTLFLGGGNDGLNTVIPADQGRYHDARPGLSKTADGALGIDEGLALNPKLANLKKLWDQG